jgi:hypothetical protein
MTSTPTIPPLSGTITVDAPIDQAFRTFTDAALAAETHRQALTGRSLRSCAE